MRRLTVLLSFVTVALVALLVSLVALGTVAQEATPIVGGAQTQDLTPIATPTTVAQEGTPPADEFELPEGVTFEGLAFGLAEALPPGPTGLGLFRFRLEPGARLDLAPDPSYFLVSIESGAITFRVSEPVRVTRAMTGTPGAQTLGPDAPAEEVSAGTDVTLEQGDAALFPPGAGGEARNDGQGSAVGLVMSVGPAEAEGAVGTPEATPTT